MKESLTDLLLLEELKIKVEKGKRPCQGKKRKVGKKGGESNVKQSRKERWERKEERKVL